MSEDESAIRTLVADWMDASMAGDQAAVLAMMTDDVLFMVPGREPFGKAAFAAASQGTGQAAMEGTADVVEVGLLGARWAYSRVRIAVTVTPPTAAPVHRAGYAMSILHKGDDGRWRIARDANLVTVQDRETAGESR